MLKQQDLIPLLARITCSVLSTHNDPEHGPGEHLHILAISNIDWFYLKVQDVVIHQLDYILYSIYTIHSKFPPEFADQCLKPTWIKNLDAFRHIALGGRDDQGIIQTWRLIGVMFGFKEKQMLGQRPKGQALDHLLGCSWHRCIMHNQVPHIKRIMFQDTNQCRKAQYCSSESLPSCWRLVLI